MPPLRVELSMSRTYRVRLSWVTQFFKCSSGKIFYLIWNSTHSWRCIWVSTFFLPSCTNYLLNVWYKNILRWHIVLTSHTLFHCASNRYSSSSKLAAPPVQFYIRCSNLFNYKFVQTNICFIIYEKAIKGMVNYLWENLWISAESWRYYRREHWVLILI